MRPGAIFRSAPVTRHACCRPAKGPQDTLASREVTKPSPTRPGAIFRSAWPRRPPWRTRGQSGPVHKERGRARKHRLEMEAPNVHKHCVKVRIPTSSLMAATKVYANLKHTDTLVSERRTAECRNTTQNEETRTDQTIARSKRMCPIGGFEFECRPTTLGVLRNGCRNAKHHRYVGFSAFDD